MSLINTVTHTVQKRIVLLPLITGFKWCQERGMTGSQAQSLCKDLLNNVFTGVENLAGLSIKTFHSKRGLRGKRFLEPIEEDIYSSNWSVKSLVLSDFVFLQIFHYHCTEDVTIGNSVWDWGRGQARHQFRDSSHPQQI